MDITPHNFLHVSSAEYISQYKLGIVFDDGTDGVVDLEQELWGEVFEPLKDQKFFQSFEVSKELGTVVWPNGADFAPEFLKEKLTKN